MRYLSVCSGIEAATVAWQPLGWTPVAFAETATFPSSVLAHRHPHVPNLGDFTEITTRHVGPISLLVGGTPCQSFSVAGLRGGLGDARGNLALEYVRLADRLRPRWVVWENVPGVLSSNGGRDFGAILGALAAVGYGLAYRVLDAQYVRVDGYARAVPQRRQRVFLVGYLGDWRRAAAVLFEPESLHGHPPARRETRPQITAGASSGLVPHVSRCLDAGGTGRLNATSETLIPIAFNSHERHVRRLTPLECERLQGFPDGYTAIPTDQVNRAVDDITAAYLVRTGQAPDTASARFLAADGPRYMAIGLSMAVNAMRWIGRRIEMVDNLAQQET